MRSSTASSPSTPQTPLDTLHIAVDAPVQFNSLLFIPRRGQGQFGFERDRYGLDLYVKRVLIQHENKDLVPEHLGFLKGVVDTEDLPLNISRETLQENILVRKIAQTVTKQVLSHLEKMAADKPADYEAFWKAHAKTFKLGYADFANRDKFAPLLRFNSSAHADASALMSLDDYLARAKEGQKSIYYASGPSREAIKLNPHLEIFRSKGVEVLYLYEPIDEFLMDALREYKDHPLCSAETADLAELEALATVPREDEPRAETLPEGDEKSLGGLLAAMKGILGDRVTEVRLSRRLTDSPCCLVSPDGAMSSSMQKILQTMTRDASIPPKALEINKDHPLTRNLLRLYKADPAEEHLRMAVEQMFEAGLLLEGYLSDPHGMVERTLKLLERSSGWLAEIKGA